MSEQILNNVIQTLKDMRKALFNNNLLTEEDYEVLDKIIEHADAPITLLIMGEFSTGKSTFINALVGKEVAAIGALPTTAVITKLCYGVEDTTTVYFRDGNSKIYDQEEFEKLTTETEDAKTKNIRENIKYVERKLPIDILQYVTFIDSPGLNGLYEVHTNTTKEFADNADAVLWMFSAAKAVSSSEMAAMEALTPRLKPFAIINQIDTIDPEEDDVEEFLADIKNKLKNKVQDVIGISALMALKGKFNNNKILLEESNFSALKEAIETKVIPNRAQYKLNSLLDELSEWLCSIEDKCNDYKNEIESLKSADYEKYIKEKSTIVDFDSNIQKITEAVKGYCIAYNNLNNIPAMFMTGLLYYYGLSLEKNTIKAFEIIEEVAAKQHYIAQKFLIFAYLKAKNYQKSFYWAEKAVEHNDADIEFLLGEFYLNGLGTDKDEFKAVEYYKKAAEKDFMKAQKSLANCYHNGFGVKQNYTMALNWYKLAANDGDAEAQNIVGEYFEEGYGVVKDLLTAAKWYKKAALQNFCKAQCNLARYYFDIDKTETFNWCKKAALQNDAEAQNMLGRCYLEGWGITKNETIAFYWCKKAAENGLPIAQNNLAICYQNGIGVENNEEEAFKWFAKALENGIIGASVNLGYYYLNGIRVNKDEAKAFKLFEKAAEQNNPEAQNMLGRCYEEGWGVYSNYEDAVKWYTKAAEQKLLAAQVNLAKCYLNGRGVKENKQKAIGLLKYAAEKGNDNARIMLGHCYEEGLGVTKDYTVAFDWYKKAADNKDAYALYKVGYCIENGLGVTKDKNVAYQWYQLAANQGYAPGEYLIGKCYENGIGVSINYLEAFNWYKKAADKGYLLAQYQVGFCYENGIGITKNENIAINWYKLALDNGDTRAKARLDYLKELLNAKLWYDLGNKYYKNNDKKQAFEYYEKAANNGNAAAIGQIGKFYANGEVVNEDFEKALYYFYKGYQCGDAESAYMYGRCIEKGWGCSKDKELAIEYYTYAANKNNVAAMYRLSFIDEGTKRSIWYNRVKKLANQETLNKLDELWNKQNPHSHFYYAFICICFLLLIALGPVGWACLAFPVYHWCNRNSFRKFL